MKDFYDIIKSRRSIRGYKSDEVPADKLARILDAGTYAPTGRGKQSPQIIAIKDKMTRDRFSALNAAVLGTDSDPLLRCACDSSGACRRQCKHLCRGRKLCA